MNTFEDDFCSDYDFVFDPSHHSDDRGLDVVEDTLVAMFPHHPGDEVGCRSQPFVCLLCCASPRVAPLVIGRGARYAQP
jgi:hypothetical protein